MANNDDDKLPSWERIAEACGCSVYDAQQAAESGLRKLREALEYESSRPKVPSSGPAAETEAQKNRDSFVRMRNRVILRRSNEFVNHMYVTPDGEFCRAVVGHDTCTGVITVSFATEEDIGSMTAVEIVQSRFGQLASGNKTIARSPHGKQQGCVMLSLIFMDVVTSIRRAEIGENS